MTRWASELLIVEGSPAFGRALARIVAGQGYSSRVADSAEEALRLAAQRAFGGALIHLGADARLGWRLAVDLRRTALPAPCPIFILARQPCQAPPPPAGPCPAWSECSGAPHGDTGGPDQPIERSTPEAAGQQVVDTAIEQVGLPWEASLLGQRLTARLGG